MVTLLFVNESCRYSRRIAVTSKPPPGNPPSLEEVYIKNKLGALDR